MKAIDSISIGIDGRSPLTLRQLEEFVQKNKKWDSVLRFNYEKSDQRSAVYDVFLCADLHDSPDLKIDPDFRWELAERVSFLKRVQDETLKDWHKRVDASIHDHGYIVNNEGQAEWAIGLHHKGAKYQTDKKSRRTHYLGPNDQWFTIYPFPNL